MKNLLTCSNTGLIVNEINRNMQGKLNFRLDSLLKGKIQYSLFNLEI